MFINTLDYSLDLIRLRKVYWEKYRNSRFSFMHDNKEYTQHVINLTFNYSNKEFNQIRKGFYIKNGYSKDEVVLKDNICIKDGELIAIQCYGVTKPKSKTKQEDKKKSKTKDGNAKTSSENNNNNAKPDSPNKEKTKKPTKKEQEWKKVCAVTNRVSQEVLGKYFVYDKDEKCYMAKPNIKTLKSVADIRTELYNEGFVCDGIEYVRWKRSAGSSRVGRCLFINKQLYNKMNKWDMCGIEISDGQKVDLAALESYISLTSSSIIDTMIIKPKNILVIDDYESVFKDSVMVTKVVGESLVTGEEKVEISNSIWDGQSLLDSSLFGKYRGYGMLLLRARFFKSCCFNTDIGQWFADNGINNVSQLNGFTTATNVEDIKLITTPSSIKFLKFGTLNEWLNGLNPVFGIVKHEKPTHYFDGRMVQCHYQLINTIQLSYEEVGDLVHPSFDFLNKLVTDPSVLRYYIQYQENSVLEMSLSESKNDVVYKLLGLNKNFMRTKLYHQFVTDLAKSMVRHLRKGHILVHGTYCTLFGNPVEMLQESIGMFDKSHSKKSESIHTTFFKDGTRLLGSRSPHVTVANVLLCKNEINPLILKYFNLTNEIVCVNSIHNNLLERLSGADFDSDTMLLTDNKILIKCAKRNYKNFKVPTKKVNPILNEREFTADGKSDLDIKTSINKIGVNDCNRSVHSAMSA